MEEERQSICQIMERFPWNGKRMDYRSVIGDRQFIHKIQVKNFLVFAGVVVPRGATQKTFKTLNNQANEYKYWKNPW